MKDGVWFVGTSVNGPWAVALGAGGDLHHPTQLAPPLCHIRLRVRRHATNRNRWLYAGLLRHGVGSDGSGGLRNGLHLPARLLGIFLVSAAGHLRFGAGFFWGSVTGFAFGAAAGAIWGGAWGHWGGYGSYTNVNINNYNSYNHWSNNQVRTNAQRNYNAANRPVDAAATQ